MLRFLTGAVERSAAVAALWAVHPLHVESVAWVAERKDVLSTFFWLLTVGLYAWYVRRPSVGRYAPVVLAFALGLLAKPMLVTLPFALLLLDYWPLGRLGVGERGASAPCWDQNRGLTPPALNLSRTVLERVPLIVLVVIASVITVHAQEKVGAVVQTAAIPFSARVANALVSYGAYLVQTFWPRGLSVFYPHRFGRLPAWQVVAAALVLAAVTALAVRQRRQRPYLLVGWLWFLGTLVPVIGLVQAGEQTRADRFVCVPHIGLFIAVVWGVAELLARWPRMVAAALTAAVLVALAIGTGLQVRHWRDSETIWEHAIDVDPDNPRAHANLGSLLFSKEKLRAAEEHLARSVELDPSVAETRYVLACLLRWRDPTGRRREEVVKHLREVIRLRPDWSVAYLDLGLVQLQGGELTEAEMAFRAAGKLDPRTAEMVNHQGEVEALAERWREAACCFRVAVEINDRVAAYRFNLAQALWEQGQMADARSEYRVALQLDPRWPMLVRLGISFWEGGSMWDQRDPARVVWMARELDMVAVMQAEAGNFLEAITNAERAIEVVRRYGEKEELARRIEGRLQCYRKGEPYGDGK